MVELFPYQEAGVEHLTSSTSKLAYLADDMGLGKSFQAIRAADRLEAEDILVVCPASVRVNWAREIAKFQLDDSVPVTVLQKGTDELPEWGWVICSYDWVTRNHERLAKRWDVMILDEAHFVRNASAQRTKRIAGGKGLMRFAEHVFALSGTPMVNNAGELWTLLAAGAPELLAVNGRPLRYWAFVNRYCHVIDNGFGNVIAGNRSAMADELTERIAPVFLRRTKEEVLTDLPSIRFEQLFVEGAAPPLDDAVVAEVEALLDEIEGRGAGGEISAAVATVRRLTGLAKVDPVADIVADECQASKIIVAAYHRAVIERLHERLPDAVVVHGGTSAAVRQEAIDRFQGDDACRVFIGQITAAGTGINLTAASDVLFVESSWTPADNAQMAARAHRIGQTRPVLVRFATLAGSIDERIAEVIARKARDFDRLFSEEKTDAA